MYGMNFGLASAPNQFNRISHHMTLAAQHIFGACTSYYYDDVPCVEPDFVLGTRESRGDESFSEHAQREYPYFYHLYGTYRGSSQWCIGLYAFLIGYPFAQKKRVLPGPTRKFLGVMTDFSHLAQRGIVRMYIAPARRDKLTRLIKAALAAPTFSGAAAARLAGKLSFVLTQAMFRFGRAALQPVFRHAQRAGSAMISASLRAALMFFLSTLPALPERAIRVFVKDRKDTDPRVYIWTDACWSPTDVLRNAGLGIVLFLPARYVNGVFHPCTWHYAEGNCPHSFIERFCLPRSQRIGELELLAAVCAYLTFPQLLAGRRVTHWIDNTGALAALIKGYASEEDLAKIVHAFAATNLGLRCIVWFEYVRSKANVADFPSRGDFAFVHALGAKRSEMVMPQLDWWDAAPMLFVEAARTADRRSTVVHASTDAVRSRSKKAPVGEPSVRPRRRSYTKRSRDVSPNRIPPKFVRAHSKEDLAIPSDAEVCDVDVTRKGPFGNPFPLGPTDSLGSLRRECIATYQAWLQAAPPMEAGAMLVNGRSVPCMLRPRKAWKAWTSRDVTAAMHDLLETHRGVEYFRLICSPACDGRLCHSDILAREFSHYACCECV